MPGFDGWAAHGIRRHNAGESMHDIKAIRDGRDAFAGALARRPAYRQSAGDETDRLLAKDRELRELLVKLQTDQARRNKPPS